MGDRTYTEIILTKAGFQKLEEIYKTHKNQNLKDIAKDFGCEIRKEGGLIKVVDSEANYAQIGIEDTLHENSIEYDKNWEAGGDYPAGREYARNVDGKYVSHELSLEDTYLLDAFKRILNSKDLKKAIDKELKRLEPFKVEPLDRCNAKKFINDILPGNK